MISVEHLKVEFSARALFSDVSFVVNKRDRIALVGKNGAGKSTMLKILAGIQQPTDGHVAVQRDVSVGYLPQVMVLSDDTTVAAEVEKAFAHIHQLKDRVRRLNDELSSRTDYDTPEYMELVEAFSRENDRLQMMGAQNYHAEIERTLTGLGFNREDLERPTREFSGGWRMRIELAKLLLARHDVLLLDEPTNHLDIDAILWLENLLKNFAGSLIVITHDRRFLDNIATRIVELDRGILRSYPGSFSKYSEKKAQELAVEAEHNRLFDKFHAQEEAWIRKGIEARRTRNEGRVRRLEELRRQRAERRNVQGQVNFKLDSGEKSGKIIAELEYASFAYGDKVIMDKFSAILQRGDKIGLIGPNGIGKTTFLKLILGELQPTYGRIRIGSKQEVAYFDQFRSALNENDTVFYTLGQGNDYVEVGGKKKHVMSYLEDFLFHPARAQSPVSSLSGGERNRLLLAKLFTRPANILVLDEPTNDLDIDTQELLEDLLRDYQGTVFLVSHDRMFLDNVITQSIVFEGQGRLKEYIGGYQDYIDAKSREEKIQTASAPKAVAEPEKVKPKANRTVKLSYKEQRELDALPDEIAALETEQAEINTQLSDPEIFKDYEKAGALQSRAEEIEMLLLEKLERWEWLEAKQNGEAV